MIRRNIYLKTQGLAAGILLAGLCVTPRTEAASNLVNFDFNEGPGSETITSKAGNLIGTLGHVINPANRPILSADAPSAQAGDRAVQINGLGFLAVNDSPNPVLGVQTNAFTVETW